MLKLDADKRKLLTQLLLKRVAGQIPRRPEGQMIVACSYGQRRLWFLDELERGSPVYQISQAVPIEGPLVPAILERSLAAIVQRHEALRTTFSNQDGEPVQVIATDGSAAWRLIDVSGFPEHERDEAARGVAAADAREPFDLAVGPLIRATLVRRAADSHVLLLTLHHIIADGWSIDVLLSELRALHDSFACGRNSPLPDLPIQYADYSLWQRSQLTPARVSADVVYWRQQLDELPQVALPSNGTEWGSRTTKGAREFFEIQASRVRVLETIAKREDATLFMALLAIIQILLTRYSAQDDIAVGSVVAGRNRPELEGLIGFFLNTVCLRTNLSGNPTFTDLLARVRKTALGAYAHQDLPFELLVEDLAPDRSRSQKPLFNVMFVLQTNRERRGPSLDTDDENPNRWPLESGTSKFDLTWSIAESVGGLVCALEYSTDLFDAAAARRMVGHFATLLDSVTDNPDARIESLHMLTEAERETILGPWSAIDEEYAEPVRVHESVALHAAHVPHAVAIRFSDSDVSFSDLNSRANRVAHYLRMRGAQPQDRIGVRMYRTPDLLVATLAIWKAACVYVPLDADDPDQRIADIIRDAGLRIVLEVPLDTCEINSQPDTEPECIYRPDDLAYILYTSGSTGTPKGVMVEHRSLNNYLAWVNRQLLGTRPQLMPAIAKPTFDASLKQLLAPLVRGSHVWLVAESVVSEADRLLEYLSRSGDFTLNCVPWLWKVLLASIESGQSAAAPRLKRLLIGGEELSQELIDRTFKSLRHVELWNLYGPTEATCNATAVRLLPGDRTSIGRPVTNAVALVLGREQQLLPIGVPGELHVGGHGVARGYWANPELTAQRFMINPFGAGRLYKTGDRARYRPDGCVEFLGRIDRQLKFRGLRIEPGEIEACLERHPSVQASAVALETGPRGQRLVAFTELRSGTHATASELRIFARRALPDYMVPAVFMLVDSLPRTGQGKIDRRRLTALPVRVIEHDSVTSQDPDEQRVAAVWEAVLQVSPIDPRFNFFELGGHSLLLTQAIARIRDAYGVSVSLRAVFDDPTLHGFVDAIHRARAASDAGLPAITRIDRASRRMRVGASEHEEHRKGTT